MKTFALKLITASVVLLSYSLPLFSQTKLTKDEGKIKVYKFYFNNCGACTFMDSQILSQSLAKKYIEQKFSLEPVNGLVSPGDLLAKKYHINTYPTLIFTDTLDNAFYRLEGSPNNVNDFIEELKAAEKAFTNKILPSNFDKLYQKRKNDAVFISGYIETLKASGGNQFKIDSVFNSWFLANNKVSTLRDSIAALTILNNLNHIKTPQYAFFKSNEFKFKKYVTNKQLELKVVKAVENSVEDHINELDSSDLQELKKRVNEMTLIDAEEKRESILNLELTYYMSKKNYSKSISLMENALDPLFSQLRKCKDDSCRVSISQDIVVKLNNNFIAYLSKTMPVSDKEMIKKSLIGWNNNIKEIAKIENNAFTNMIDKSINRIF